MTLGMREGWYSTLERKQLGEKGKDKESENGVKDLLMQVVRESARREDWIATQLCIVVVRMGMGTCSVRVTRLCLKLKQISMLSNAA